MGNKHGDWIWYELMTPDADAAAAFYGPILGWTAHKPDMGGMDYRIAQAADGDMIAGILPLTDEMKAGGAQPCWLGYIAVTDVDASAAAIAKAGGTVCIPPTDIPQVGRFAMLFDPQGAPFYIMTPASKDQTSRAFADDVPSAGHCAWNELSTSDQKAAETFYMGQFGWVQDGSMDMGPMGTYDFMRHGALIGAITPKPPEMPVSAWTFYFRVPDIMAAKAQVTASGGTVLLEPVQVPGDDWIIIGRDPQGAHFALVGKSG